MKVNVSVNLKGLTKFTETLEADLRLSGNGPIRAAMHEWNVLIARFLTARWEKMSHGGWTPLRPVTLARKAKLGLLMLILRATDKMFQAFSPEFARKPGKVSQDIPFGVRIGFGPDMRYPHTKGGPTMASIAMWHQSGAGRLPVRKIIVPPDTATKAQMRAVMTKAMKEVANGG